MVRKFFKCPEVDSYTKLYYAFSGSDAQNNLLRNYSYTMPQGSTWSIRYDTMPVVKRTRYKNPSRCVQVTDGTGVSTYGASSDAVINPDVPLSHSSSGRRVDYRHAKRLNVLTIGLNVVSTDRLKVAGKGYDNQAAL